MLQKNFIYLEKEHFGPQPDHINGYNKMNFKLTEELIKN